jgi:hypothetical protein
MDGWNGRYLANVCFVFKRCFRKEKEKGVGQSTQRVLSWHDDGSEYLEGTVEES